MRRQFRVGDEHVRAGIVQDVTHLGGFQEIVDGHDHAAGRQDAEHRRHKLRTIFHPQRHAVAGFHAESAGDSAATARDCANSVA